MTAKQIKYARAMMAKANVAAYKEELVASFSNGRTTSLTAMDYSEAQELFKHLEKLLGQPPSVADKQKRKILSLAHEMRWYVEGFARKLDMPRINEWCKTKFGSELDDLNYLDLNKAVFAFSKVHEGYLKGF